MEKGLFVLILISISVMVWLYWDPFIVDTINTITESRERYQQQTEWMRKDWGGNWGNPRYQCVTIQGENGGWMMITNCEFNV